MQNTQSGTASAKPVVSTVDGLVDWLLKNKGHQSRLMIGLAGPPAAGKSTTAQAIMDAFIARGETAAVLSMDGFHYDDAVLQKLGLAARKGAPPTFDVAGFEILLKRLADREHNVAIPIFDRSLELARAGAQLIGADIKFLIVEGNYLLLDYQPWDRLKSHFDFTVFLDVPIAELDRRLVARWAFFGREKQEARSWIDNNDLPNIAQVFERSQEPDIRFISL